MTLNQKARILLKIEMYLQKAYDCCRDNVDRTEDLSSKVVDLCRELRYIEEMENNTTTSRHSGFVSGSLPTYPGETE
jgi:hypothetical protein